ncbi:hypothetical protein V8F33_002929 [Rhypophila sp. PSN 637]
MPLTQAVMMLLIDRAALTAVWCRKGPSPGDMAFVHVYLSPFGCRRLAGGAVRGARHASPLQYPGPGLPLGAIILGHANKSPAPPFSTPPPQHARCWQLASLWKRGA